MDARQAKREACWLAAGLIDSCLAAGLDLAESVPAAVTAADQERVAVALREVIEELERRGGAR